MLLLYVEDTSCLIYTEKRNNLYTVLQTHDPKLLIWWVHPSLHVLLKYPSFVCAGDCWQQPQRCSIDL